MKKTYVKPVFVAEGYTFTESIASCYKNPDANTSPVKIPKFGTNLCAANDGGHKAGDGGMYTKETDYPLTIFNDGAGKVWDKIDHVDDKGRPYLVGCDYDWAGETKEGLADFSQDFYGNNSANSHQHRPAINGYPLQS